MKIQQTQDQMVIDNSLITTVAVGAILGIAGVAIGIYGIVKHVPVAMGIGLALALAGALFVALSRSTHIVLAKTGESSVSSKTLFSASKSEAFSLAEVSSVLLATSEIHSNVKDGDGSVREQTKVTANIFLLTKTAQRIHIGTATQIMNVSGIIGALIESLPLRLEAIRIAAFIGVPMQSSDAVGVSPFTS